MKKYLVANWKMHGSVELCEWMADSLMDHTAIASQILVAPPDLWITTMREVLEARRLGVHLVGQHGSHRAMQVGPYTGECSMAMLRRAGCVGVLVGHSERRLYHHETDAEVVDGVKAAWDAGLGPILCVGETREERQSGQWLERLEEQLCEVLPLYEATPWASALWIAYEPVWAIGTGERPSTKDLEDWGALFEKKFIRTVAKPIKLLYGGSVDGAVLEAVCRMAWWDGVLVGGASVQREAWSRLLRVLTDSRNSLEKGRV